MSRAEREAFQAQLAADPALRAAWDDFQARLATAAGQIMEGDDPDLESVRAAADKVMAEAGGDALLQ